LESGDLTGQIEPIDVGPMLDEIAEEYQERARARNHTVTIESPPGTIALGVPRLVREAAVNYLTNAIKYTPEAGSIRVTASRIDSRVRVAVDDNGIGIPTEKHDRVFGEYARFAPKDPRLGKTEGTGLGLSIVKKSIERQGGRVGFESHPGTGSTFWFELPSPDN
ncbi:MAG: HAMP domain-containing histidine kinase, partial [Phycisphaerales bacterium]|nr:HAMP domain-containing histidine kinase [Phycisphaerales bacterium]